MTEQEVRMLTEFDPNFNAFLADASEGFTRVDFTGRFKIVDVGFGKYLMGGGKDKTTGAQKQETQAFGLTLDAEQYDDKGEVVLSGTRQMRVKSGVMKNSDKLWADQFQAWKFNADGKIVPVSATPLVGDDGEVVKDSFGHATYERGPMFQPVSTDRSLLSFYASDEWVQFRASALDLAAKDGVIMEDLRPLVGAVVELKQIETASDAKRNATTQNDYLQKLDDWERTDAALKAAGQANDQHKPFEPFKQSTVVIAEVYSWGPQAQRGAVATEAKKKGRGPAKAAATPAKQDTPVAANDLDMAAVMFMATTAKQLSEDAGGARELKLGIFTSRYLTPGAAGIMDSTFVVKEGLTLDAIKTRGAELAAAPAQLKAILVAYQAVLDATNLGKLNVDVAGANVFYTL